VKEGPVILSVHYKFDPKSTIPHLVVIDAVDNGVVYYNDPAAKTGEKQISVTNFLKGWKKKVIVIRPVQKSGGIALAKI
jgi:predicted double-glycine peptidase